MRIAFLFSLGGYKALTAIKRGVKERALCNYAKKMYMIYGVNQKFYLSLPILLSFNHFSNYIAIAHY